MSSPTLQTENLDWLSYFQIEHTPADILVYDLPDGRLSVYRKSVSITVTNKLKKQDIFTACNRVIKQTMQQQMRQAFFDLNKSTNKAHHSVLVIDVFVLKDDKRKRLSPEFGAQYFKEHFSVEMADKTQMLHVFSRDLGQDMLAILQTPCELWRFLDYHHVCLQQTLRTGDAMFVSEKQLLKDFMTSHDIFKQAIAVDNALINYKLKTEPNPVLVAMASTQQSNSATAQISYEHISQAAQLWTQLCLQMNLQLPSPPTHAIYQESLDNGKTATHKAMLENDKERQRQNSLSWIKELLDESLFSRYELIKEIYLYPNQPDEMKRSGYVVHQHSYESLGRHYVMVFYGNEINSPNSRLSIQPKLQDIAKDIANRLTITELHHVVILGIEFIESDKESFIDMDVFIQSIDTMTEKERHLAQQLDMMRLQEAEQKKHKSNANAQSQSKKLPSLNLKITK